MNNRSIFCILTLSVIFLMISCTNTTAQYSPLLFGFSTQATEKINNIKTTKPPSTANGTLRNGELKNAAALSPARGTGYYLAHPKRGSRYGHDRLIFGIMSMGAEMVNHFGEQMHNSMRVHDISNPHGGKLSRHINHQLGLDVDIAFYATSLEGKPINSVWLAYDEDGRSADGKRLFDTQRNWVLVEEMIGNQYFRSIRSTLVSNQLKARLLSFAKRKRSMLNSNATDNAEKLDAVIEQAQSMLRQPVSSPHNNHFHLSLKLRE
ncbi:MAG: hypothetical protein ACJAVV_002635 [Alphaproteobacteria bacterium]|jgi:hypothetical protein